MWSSRIIFGVVTHARNMGGHALKRVRLVRKPPEAYARIKEHVLGALRDKGFVCCVPAEVPQKESFGDLDVLYVKKDRHAPLDFIRAQFQPTQIVVNGPVASFDITVGNAVLHNFQIDLIACAQDEYEMAAFYYSYGDFGGVLGRVVSANMLKIGSAGLWMDVNVDTFDENGGSKDDNLALNKDRIVLTTSPRATCDFLGLDYDAWLAGFASVEDSFRWVCASPLFTAAAFTCLNYQHRARAAKRPYYRKFLDFIDVNADSIVPASQRTSEAMDNLQARALVYFNKQSVLDKLRTLAQQRKQRSDKFSAFLFMRHGLQGRALGLAIAAFKEQRGDWDAYVDATPAETIAEEVTRFCATLDQAQDR